MNNAFKTNKIMYYLINEQSKYHLGKTEHFEFLKYCIDINFDFFFHFKISTFNHLFLCRIYVNRLDDQMNHLYAVITKNKKC